VAVVETSQVMIGSGRMMDRHRDGRLRFVQSLGAMAAGAGLLALVGCRPAVPPARPVSESAGTPPAPSSPETATAATQVPPRSSLDSDGDGVADDQDSCPDEPGMEEPSHAIDGCPHGRSPDHWPPWIQIIDWVPFASGEAVIDADAADLLDNLASALRASDLILMEVIGHASAEEQGGSKLALARARAVIDGLVARGVERAHLTPRADPQPLRPHWGTAQRMGDWRVEFRTLRTVKAALGADGWHLTPPCRKEQPIPQTIEFVRDGDRLVPEAGAALDEVAAFLQQHPEVGKAKLLPSFETPGVPVISDQISVLTVGAVERRGLARALVNAVRAALIARGVPAERLIRGIPRFPLPGAERYVQVIVNLPNPDRDPIAPGCVEGG